LNYKF